MKKGYVLLLLLAYGCAPPPFDEVATASHSSAPRQGEREATVAKVIDGDTIVLDTPESEVVRYIGIDAPELTPSAGQCGCYGPEALERNRALLEGRRVQILEGEERWDRWRRTLAYVFVEGRLINALLLAEGYARALAIDPNTEFAGYFETLEGEARQEGIGLWDACREIPECVE
ncbi:MAG: thermonuclease family protein [Deltaproteobacteria bacterium]|nr:MAG: thermonuclease family protein [Deltaproteobacteria bacterium]